MYLKTDLIFVVTNKVGYIPQLRMNGPIPTPVKIDVASCVSILTSGFPLWQFDPISKKVVKLTLSNVLDNNKFKETKVEVKETKVSKPVVTEPVLQVAVKVEEVVVETTEETDTTTVVEEPVEEVEDINVDVVEEVVVETAEETDTTTVVEEPVINEVKTTQPKNKNKNKKKNK